MCGVNICFSDPLLQEDYAECVDSVIALSTASAALAKDECYDFIFAVEAELHSGALRKSDDIIFGVISYIRFGFFPKLPQMVLLKRKKPAEFQIFQIPAKPSPLYWL